jgi:DNA-binding CsgD family transcriptional regulator
VELLVTDLFNNLHYPFDTVSGTPKVESSAATFDHAVVTQNLRLPIVVFRGTTVAYRNKAGERLARWLRDEYGTELTTLLRDHVAQVEGRKDSLSLVRIPEGSHLFIEVFPLDGGYRVVGIRAPGLELMSIAQHYRLSPREVQVVSYVLRGYSNQTIADSLGVTNDTVKKHLTRVFDKVGVDSRTQLMSLVS